MRIGNYAVSNQSGESLDFSITSFPGDVGGILANVNRWLGQVGIKPTNESGLSDYLSDRTIDEKPAKLLLRNQTTRHSTPPFFFMKVGHGSSS